MIGVMCRQNNLINKIQQWLCNNVNVNDWQCILSLSLANVDP